MRHAFSEGSNTRVCRSIAYVVIAGFVALIMLAATAEAQAPAPSSETRVTLAFAVHRDDARREPVSVAVEALWYGRGERAHAFDDRSLPDVSSRNGTHVVLPPGPWVFRAHAEGYWGEERHVLIDGPTAEVTLGLWPAGTVRGRLTLPRSTPSPDAIWVFLHPAPGHASPGAPPPAKLRCPVEDLAWSCLLPATRLDLRFQADGFVPIFRWAEAVPPHDILDLGTVALVPGSSVYGWVETVDGVNVTGRGTVRLLPRAECALARDDRDGEAERIKGRSFEATIGERGFFDFGAVAPGAYVLEGEAAPYATARRPVLVLEGEPTQVSNPPLMLDRPETIEVYLDPPVDPTGRSWRMALYRVVRSGAGTVQLGPPVAEGPAEAAGWWEAASLERGDFRLEVRSGDGETLWLRDDLTIDDDPSPVLVDLHGVAAKGSVTLEGEPLAADLSFLDSAGATRLEATSDEEGSFSLLFPHPGEWSASVSAEDVGIHSTVRGIEIKPAKLDTPATVRIALRDTLLRGRVTMEDGTPAGDAVVQARSPAVGTVDTVRTGRDGQFELRGLPEGLCVFRARGRGGFESQTVRRTLGGDSPGDEVELVLRRRLVLTGTVVSAAGSIPGATVTVEPTDRPALGVPILTTDARGRFEAPLPAGTGSIQVMVGAPGFALRMLHIPLPEDGRLPLRVGQAGGTLALDLGAPYGWFDPDSPTFTIRHGAASAPLPALLNWAGQHGSNPQSPFRRVEIPALEPGEYALCWSPRPDQPTGASELEPGCVAGTLTASGTLELHRPVAQIAP